MSSDERSSCHGGSRTLATAQAEAGHVGPSQSTQAYSSRVATSHHRQQAPAHYQPFNRSSPCPAWSSQRLGADTSSIVRLFELADSDFGCGVDTATIEELVDEICEVLEPHAAYMNHGRDGNERYWTSPEMFEALSWAVTNLVLPVLTGLGSSMLFEKLARRDGRDPETEAASHADVERLRCDLASFRDEQVSPARAVEAQQRAARALVENGWPESVAAADSEEIIVRIRGAMRHD